MTQTFANRLGPYDILSPLGSGGFGDVYKARDTRLNRTVAIKVLPSADPELKARFAQEAKAIAALTHPNICTLYDVGHQDGTDYLVMECLEGETLAARVAKGPIRIDEAVAIATQMLGALDAAHRAGVVHRDLKPANVMLTRSGVKLLDFGLAKLRQSSGAASGFDSAATSTSPLETVAGTILGTLSYMSPEQLEGHDVDARSDIFACGVVLYECISGRRPFVGASATSIIASILKEQPRALQSIQPLTPPALSRIVETCLEKDPERRWQSAAEIRHALIWVSTEPPAAAATSQLVRRWRGAAVLFAVLASASVGWALWPAALQPASRVELPPPADVPVGESLAVSPDGRKLVLSSGGGLWLRSFDSLEWRHLASTEGAASPFWSPDSRYLAFGVGNELRKIDTVGGPSETICTVAGRVEGSGSWNRGGVIIFGSWGGGSGGPLWRVSEHGGSATAVTQIELSKGELFHTWPSFLGDGSHFLYFRSGPPNVEGIYAGSLDVPPGQQSNERIVASSLPGAYAAGYLFFPRAGALIAQRFDAARLRVSDAALPIAEAIQTTWFGTGVFAVSAGGSLAYRPAAGGVTLQTLWTDRQGKTLSTLGQPSTDSSTVLSPDGKHAVAKDAPYDVPGDLWTIDLSSGERTRLTFRKDVYSPGVWSPDGARIAYAAGSLGDAIFERSASGAGGERELLRESGLRHFPTSWSSDGHFLLYHTENAPKTGYDLWVLPLKDNRTPVRLLGESFNEWAGVFSPDMRWIAYASLETGAAEIFVRPFTVSGENGQPTLGEGKWQISRDFGNWPIWRNDREIIFHNIPAGSSVFAAAVRTNDAVFESASPVRLFTIPGTAVNLVDVTDDGKRFLVPAEVGRPARSEISVVLNWPTLLKR